MVPGFAKKTSIPLSKKLEIVKFAYPVGGTKQIKPTAREFGVAPSQIRKWKASFDAVNEVVQGSSDKVGMKIIARNHSSKMKRLSGAGAPSQFKKAERNEGPAGSVGVSAVRVPQATAG